MDVKKSDIVLSLAGRDKGGLFFVIREDGGYVSIADGKSRRLEKPKRKKTTHVGFVSESPVGFAEAVNDGKVSNKDLIRALAKFRTGAEIKEGGTYVWQKTM